MNKEQMEIFEKWAGEANNQKMIESAKYLVLFASLKKESAINDGLNNELMTRDARDQYIDERNLRHGG
jgi:hypothetical protein